MMRNRILALLIAVVLGARPAQAGVAHLTYSCDLQGVEGKMVIAVEEKQVIGRVPGVGADQSFFSGIKPTGEIDVHTAGEVISPSAHYVFTGWNYYASFTDILRGGEFIVRFEPQPGGDLVLSINPFQSPELQGRLFCRRVQ
jgi:hypothetical protein